MASSSRFNRLCAASQFLRQRVGRLPLAPTPVLFLIHVRRPPQQFLDSLLPILLLLAELTITHRPPTAGVGFQLGAINSHVPQLHQPRLLAQPQRLHKQLP
ncbi:MAG TPA: hypothetical protein VMT32_02840, partial [Bryobacteraceae bacterium]|nr:hypothetical protein [Bryobacteraceae bacterium]